MKTEEYTNIAVLIDAENVSSTYLKRIFESIAAFGQISVRRIYSDWTDPLRNSWKQLIREYSIIPIQQFDNKDGKNVSDFALVIDAMDLLHEGMFDCFCIVSSDSDFSRLAQRIREKGKTVIGIGETKAIAAFVNACNSFIYLDDNKNPKEIKLEKPKKETKIKSVEAFEIKPNSIDELISIAMNKLCDEDGWVNLVKVIPYLKQIRPDFNLSIYGFSRLSSYFKNDKYELRDENRWVREKKKE